MLSLKFAMPKRELDLHPYHLTQEKSREKSCFIDHNRPDTVKIKESDKKKKS